MTAAIRESAAGYAELRSTLDEPSRALLPLLDQPVIAARRTPELYAALTRELEPTRAWYAQRTGWRLDRKPEYLRLRKEPVRALGAHGWRGCVTPLDYRFAVWTMWFAEGLAGNTFPLSALARAIQQQCITETGLSDVDWTIRDQRRSLRRALETLHRLQIVEILDGDLEAYVDRGSVEILPATEALLAKGPAFRAFVVNVPDALARALADGDLAALDRAQATEFCTARQRLYRQLLLAPAFLRADDPEAFAILDDPYERDNIYLDCWTNLGWALEVTTEYAALLRPASDRVMGSTYPGASGIAFLALVAAGALRDAIERGDLAPDSAGRVAVPRDYLATLLADVQTDPTNSFGKTVRELRHDELVARTVEYLVGVGLADIERNAQRIVFSPAYGRLVGYYADDGLGMGQAPVASQRAEPSRTTTSMHAGLMSSEDPA
jgi:uncharacterized protein (TIGR02678 family)